jgi:hypothetical protein
MPLTLGLIVKSVNCQKQQARQVIANTSGFTGRFTISAAFRCYDEYRKCPELICKFLKGFGALQ